MQRPTAVMVIVVLLPLAMFAATMLDDLRTPLDDLMPVVCVAVPSVDAPAVLAALPPSSASPFASRDLRETFHPPQLG
jgi:hypothetical protein